MNSPALFRLVTAAQSSRHAPRAVRLGLRLAVGPALNGHGTRSVPATLRRGLSLMELLIATTISVMVMGATVTLFGVVGERINGGRAMIEVADRLRSTQNLLHHDLRGLTGSILPWEQ